MKRDHRKWVWQSGLATAIGLLLITSIARATWDPNAYRDESTLEVLTVGPDEGDHWSTLWLVVIDNAVYLRLGTRAAERFKQNTTAPLVSVRIAGNEFTKVRAEPAPDQAAAVAAAMAGKYWTDVFVRHFDHPLTVRLVPQASP